MRPFIAMKRYPGTWARVMKRAAEIADQTGCVMVPLACGDANHTLTVAFESDLDAEYRGIVIAKPILEAVA